MINRRKFIKRQLFNFGLYGTIIGSTFFITYLLENKEKIASVPFEVRNELYYQDIVEDYDYFNTYGRHTSTGSFMDDPTNTDRLYDKFVTYERLRKLKELEIHMNNITDLEFLEKCPNIRKLYINDAEMLNDDDINIINDSKIEQVYLSFNYDNVSKIKEKKFDINRFEKDVKINNYFYSYTNDLEQVTIYNYLDNCNKELFVDKKSYNHVKEIDDYLNRVIDEYKINEGKDDLEKIVLISNYICNSMDYDKDISRKVDKYLEKKEKNEIVLFNADSKTIEYNYHSITSIINQTNDVKQGICINYASLFDIMCYKVGIKSRLIDGLNKSYNIGHAWNIAYINNKKECIDLTYYDGLDYGTDFLENYFKTRDKLSYEVITSNLIRDINKYSAYYNLYEEVDDLDKKPEKISTYVVNEELDNFPVINKDIDLKKNLILFLLGGSTGIIVDVSNKKRKNKSLKLTSKK